MACNETRATREQNAFSLLKGGLSFTRQCIASSHLRSSESFLFLSSRSLICALSVRCTSAPRFVVRGAFDEYGTTGEFAFITGDDPVTGDTAEPWEIHH